MANNPMKDSQHYLLLWNYKLKQQLGSTAHLLEWLKS